jgi:hypothetical protein
MMILCQSREREDFWADHQNNMMCNPQPCTSNITTDKQLKAMHARVSSYSLLAAGVEDVGLLAQTRDSYPPLEH